MKRALAGVALLLAGCSANKPGPAPAPASPAAHASVDRCTTGKETAANDDLAKAFPLKVGDTYQPAKVRANIVRLRDGYRAAGYPNAEIDHVVEPTNDGRVTVKLTIKEE